MLKIHNIPLKLKDEVNTSHSTIFYKTLNDYLKQKELDKWEKGVDLALNDEEYITLSQEFYSDYVNIC